MATCGLGVDSPDTLYRLRGEKIADVRPAAQPPVYSRDGG